MTYLLKQNQTNAVYTVIEVNRVHYRKKDQAKVLRDHWQEGNVQRRSISTTIVIKIIVGRSLLMLYYEEIWLLLKSKRKLSDRKMH